MTCAPRREAEAVVVAADGPGSGAGRRRDGALTAAVLVALALFALIGIGGPLIGHGVFAATDALGQLSPYRDAGLGGPVKSLYQNDTYDTIIPNTLLFAEGLRSGQIDAWNPYILGGVPLGATPNFAVASPLTIPYYLLPGPLAPGYVKLVEIAVAAAGAFLFGRRVGLGRPAALVGGLVFASSAFLIAWTNWPQTRTAAVIGFVFWAAERLVQRGRALDAVLLAAAVAAMLFGGFPAVTGYTLLFAGIYLVVRVLAEHRRGRWGTDLRVVATAAAGLVAGVGLAAVQLVPFVSALSGSFVAGREQTPADHLPHEALLTALAPEALGTVNPARAPAFFLPQNFVEALSYVGAVALVLAVVAVASPRRGRGLLPRGLWLYLIVAIGLTVVLAYGGGPLLAAAQELPNLFSSNYVGRVRSVLGFLVAVLAATGFEVVVRGRADASTGRGVRIYQVVVWAVAAAGGAWIWWEARGLARGVDTAAGDDVARLYLLDRHVLQALALVAVGLVAAAVLRWGRGPRLLRVALAALLPVLITAQALTLVRQYWPDSDVDTFYPVTDAQQYLAANLGHDRYAFALGAMGIGADAPLRLRALNGHTFVSQPVADLVDALPDNQFGDPPTLPVLTARPDVATSPVLDRLATRYFVTSPRDQVFGDPSGEPGDGSSVDLTPERSVTVPVESGRPLRAVAVTPSPGSASPTGDSTRVDVVVRDPDGAEVSRGSRIGAGLTAGVPFTVPVAQVPTQPGMTALVTLHGPRSLTVDATGGAPTITTVRAVADGLRLAYAGSSVIYERLGALPRIRWATQTVVEPDPARQVALVAGGTLTPQQVLLDRPGPPSAPGRADLTVVEDGSDEISVRVDAAQGGYVVVADALQVGWTVQIDGQDAELRTGDHGGVTVAVPAGQHTVTWRYGSAADRLGGLTTGLAALLMVAVLGAEARRRDLRRRGSGGGARYDSAARPGPTRSPSIPTGSDHENPS